MITDITPLSGVVTVSGVMMVAGFLKEKVWLALPSALVFMATGLVYCENTPAKLAERKAEAEEARRAAIPHVIRDADGCKVYAFSAGGHEHYYTRCAESVTTERFYSVKVPCGKNCTRDEPRSEVIVTSKGP